MAAHQVWDAQGIAQPLAEALAKGGEGTVYPLSLRPEILVKRYHPEVLEKRGTALQTKIEAMRHSSLRGQTNLSWPLISVFDDRQQWVGYAMHRIQGVPLFRLAHAKLCQKSFPDLDRVMLVRYLLRLIESLQGLHAQQVFMGDFNLQNIFCTPGSDQISLIDCDSYQIEVQGKRYPCPVGSPDLTPPEHHNKSFDKVVRTEASESFSLAIILFKCLMLGRHPYDVVGGEDPVSNLIQGRFAYGIGNRGIPVGAWYNIWSHMPHVLKNLFIQTFTEGATQPHVRPSLAQWHEVLSLYQREMEKGWHQTDIRPSEPKSKTYRGNRSLPETDFSTDNA